jgi:hypothetical protein
VHPDRAKSRPAASDWAISFSWWGRRGPSRRRGSRRRGPSSRLGHHRALDVPRPGRPGPQGESQLVSSPSL